MAHLYYELHGPFELVLHDQQLIEYSGWDGFNIDYMGTLLNPPRADGPHTTAPPTSELIVEDVSDPSLSDYKDYHVSFAAPPTTQPPVPTQPFAQPPTEPFAQPPVQHPILLGIRSLFSLQSLLQLLHLPLPLRLLRR